VEGLSRVTGRCRVPCSSYFTKSHSSDVLGLVLCPWPRERTDRGGLCWWSVFVSLFFVLFFFSFFFFILFFPVT